MPPESYHPGIGVEFLMHMQGQAFTLCIQLFNQGWVVFLNKFVEKRLLGAMALVSGVTKGILTWQQHSEWTPTSAVLKSHTVKQSLQTWNIEIGQEQISATDNPVATVMIRVRRPRSHLSRSRAANTAYPSADGRCPGIFIRPYTGIAGSNQFIPFKSTQFGFNKRVIDPVDRRLDTGRFSKKVIFVCCCQCGMAVASATNTELVGVVSQLRFKKPNPVSMLHAHILLLASQVFQFADIKVTHILCFIISELIFRRKVGVSLTIPFIFPAQLGKRRNFWVFMPLSTTYSTWEGTWSKPSTIEILEKVRLQDGLMQLPDIGFRTSVVQII